MKSIKASPVLGLLTGILVLFALTLLTMAVTVMPAAGRWGEVSPGRIPSQLRMILTGAVFLLAFGGLCAAAFLKKQRHMLLGASLYYLAPMLDPQDLGQRLIWNPFYALMDGMGLAWPLLAVFLAALPFALFLVLHAQERASRAADRR